MKKIALLSFITLFVLQQQTFSQLQIDGRQLFKEIIGMVTNLQNRIKQGQHLLVKLIQFYSVENAKFKQQNDN